MNDGNGNELRLRNCHLTLNSYRYYEGLVCHIFLYLFSVCMGQFASQLFHIILSNSGGGKDFRVIWIGIDNGI